MPKEFSRTDRMADVIQRELSMLIQREIKDPRLPAIVTISGVKVTRDFAYAKVYFTVFRNQSKLITISIIKKCIAQLCGALVGRLTGYAVMFPCIATAII